MSTQVQHRRGTTLQHASFTGAAGEITVDTDKKSVVVHDGETPGGFVSAKGGANNDITSLSDVAMAGLLTLKTGANIASAATVNLSAATGNSVHITGTTAITAITMANGQVMQIIFDGALTLTHHATNNNLPGLGNITTAAGDRALYYCDGTTVYCMQYFVAASRVAQTANPAFTGNGTITGTNSTLQVIATSSGIATLGLISGGAIGWNLKGSATEFRLFVDATEKLNMDTSGSLSAGADNTQDVGTAGRRWRTIYAGTGTINTSDAREKTPVTQLSVNELAAAKSLSKEIGTYQFLSAVAEKGDSARKHAGMTVQRAIEIMASHDLNPFGYGFICYDEWQEQPEVLDEEGNVEQEYRAAGNRYGFRVDELLLFIARGIDARLAALEAA